MEQQKQESMSNRLFKTLLMAIEANLGPVLDDLDATKVSYDAEHKVFLLPIEDKAYSDDKAWTQAVLEAVSQSVGNAKVNNIKISKAAELQLNRIVADEQMPKFGFEKENHDIVLQKTKPELVEKLKPEIEHRMNAVGKVVDYAVALANNPEQKIPWNDQPQDEHLAIDAEDERDRGVLIDLLERAKGNGGFWTNPTGGVPAREEKGEEPWHRLLQHVSEEGHTFGKDPQDWKAKVKDALGRANENKGYYQTMGVTVFDNINKNLCPIRTVDEDMGADFNAKENVIELPAKEDYEEDYEYLHDMLMAAVLATGHPDRNGRDGVIHLDGSYPSSKELDQEQLLDELVTGTMMAEWRLPAIFAPDSVERLSLWQQMLRDDPQFLVNLREDYNVAVQAVREYAYKSSKGQKTSQKTTVSIKQPNRIMKPKTQTEQKASERQVSMLINAFSNVRNDQRVWMNESKRSYPSFYPKGPGISAFNAVMLTLHADQQNLKSNLYTTYTDAKKRGENVQEKQKGVPFNWYNWSKYENRNNPDETITREQYMKLSAEEKQQYKGVHIREIRTLFNIDQTMTPMVDAKSYADAMGKREESLSTEVERLVSALSDNLVPVYPGSGVASAQYDAREDVIRMPDRNTYANEENYLHDFLVEVMRATGHGERLAREGALKNADPDASVREEMIVEIAAGVKMLELGQSAQLSQKAIGMVPEWSRQLKEDPQVLDALEEDVNKALDVVRKAERGEKVEYTADANRRKTEQMQEKQKPQVSSKESLILADIIARHGMQIHRSNFDTSEEREAFLEKFDMKYYYDHIVDALSNNLSDPEVADAAYAQAYQHAANVEQLAREYRPSEWVQAGRHEIEESMREMMSGNDKSFVIVMDKEHSRADVVLREGAFSGGKVVLPDSRELFFHLNPDEAMTQAERKEQGAKVQYSDDQGMAKNRIEHALVAHPDFKPDYVRFFNQTGVVGYHPDDRYFEGKELYVASLNKWSLDNVRRMDITEAVAHAREPQFEASTMLKDDAGKWLFFVRPKGEESFAIHPEREDLNRFFNAAHDSDPANVARIREELCSKYYALAQNKPELKVNIFGERASEEDAARLQSVNVFKTKDGKYMMSAKVTDASVSTTAREITLTQWQRMWLSPDRNQYKRDLATKIFSDILHPERKEEKVQNEVKEEKPAFKPVMSLSTQAKMLKEKHPEALILMRSGDFYLAFHEDARTVADKLGLTLTRTKDVEGKRIEEAAFPHHELDTYLPRLIRLGERVAICEAEDRKVDVKDQVEESNEENESRGFHR